MKLHWLTMCRLIFLMLITQSANAHEKWVLTPELIATWNAKPLPHTFTTLSVSSATVLLIALFINVMLFRLHRNGANELFPLFRARMNLLRPYTAVVLRVCLSWVLVSSALAMEPRFGNETWSHPTLLAPDILIAALPESWHVLRWMEIAISVFLILGIYVRIAALACLLLIGIALCLTGWDAFAYAPVYTGVSVYLYFAGGGNFVMPLPVLSYFKPLIRTLEHYAAVGRAQFILRLLAGLNFLYLAVYFKVLQPNLMLAIIDVHTLPIMGFNPEVFTLVIAVVELSIAILVIFGILLRFLSVVLIAAFVFFAICLSEAETLTSHMLYYGVALSFLFNGVGQWRIKKAKDHPANIVVVGNSLASVAAAQRLENLLPAASNIRISLLTPGLDFQFKTLLPEVVSGAIQATTLVNPLPRVLKRTDIILADLAQIDTSNHCLTYICPDGRHHTKPFDELIIATDPVTDRSIEANGSCEGVFKLESVVDAMKLKQQLLKRFIANSLNKQSTPSKPVKVAIYGGGECGSALAIEIHSLLEAVRTDRCFTDCLRVEIIVFERLLERKKMGNTLLAMRNRRFKPRKIKVLDAARVASLNENNVLLHDGRRLAVDVVINTQKRDVLPPFKELSEPPQPLIQKCLALSGSDNVWMASYSETLRINPQRRISLQLEKGRFAAFNAWAHSQSLPVEELTMVSQPLYECYMGRHTISTWRGARVPSVIGWALNRYRHLNTLPSLERKFRILIDWGLDFIFSEDRSGFLEHDYRPREQLAKPQAIK